MHPYSKIQQPYIELGYINVISSRQHSKKAHFLCFSGQWFSCKELIGTYKQDLKDLDIFSVNFPNFSVSNDIADQKQFVNLLPFSNANLHNCTNVPNCLCFVVVVVVVCFFSVCLIFWGFLFCFVLFFACFCFFVFFVFCFLNVIINIWYSSSKNISLKHLGSKRREMRIVVKTVMNCSILLRPLSHYLRQYWRASPECKTGYSKNSNRTKIIISWDPKKLWLLFLLRKQSRITWLCVKSVQMRSYFCIFMYSVRIQENTDQK